jgi:hypothetical protein
MRGIVEGIPAGERLAVASDRFPKSPLRSSSRVDVFWSSCNGGMTDRFCVALVRIGKRRCATRPNKEIEICPLARLEHVLNVQFRPATLRYR